MKTSCAVATSLVFIIPFFMFRQLSVKEKNAKGKSWEEVREYSSCLSRICIMRCI